MHGSDWKRDGNKEEYSLYKSIKGTSFSETLLIMYAINTKKIGIHFLFKGVCAEGMRL